MRIKLSSVDEINKILRNNIIELSELSDKKVVNGYSIHGADLETQLNKYCVDSYKPEDSYIVFELQPRDSYMTETDYDDNLTIDSAYRMRLFIYGNNTTSLVNKLVARLLTDENRLLLQNQGVYLENISNIENGTDFLNDTLFPRTDLDINIYCEQEISKTSSEIDSLDTLNIFEIMEENNG